MMYFNNNKTTPSSLYGTQWNPRYNNKTPSKVVSIPVHFVGSERNRTDSATKIQKVVRGFLVRKSVKKMLKMKVELEEIEKNVNGEGMVMKMKKEQKEKLRIGETIMNLLLRLDSVRVFHCSALRDFRKSLIKRAIFLQEFVDQIQMVGPTDEVEDGEGKCAEVEENSLEKEEHEGDKKIEALVNEENEDGNKIEALMNEDEGCEEEHEGGETMQSLVNEDGGEGKCVEEEENWLMKEKEEEGEDEEMNKMEGLWKEEKMEEEDSEESVGTSYVEKGIEVDSGLVKEEEGRIGIECEEKEDNCYKEGDCGNREMLKRMMKDNEKMMHMMSQLFERNEKQTTILTSLTQRVEQLERAFTCDKLRRKKKRRHVDAKHNRHNGCF